MLRILAVDDDVEILEAYKRALATESNPTGSTLRQALRIAPPDKKHDAFALTLSTQGEVALEQFKAAQVNKQGFDVVFLDMRMPPGWDGLRTAEEIRALDEEVFIVFVSAYTDRTMEELRMRLGDKLMMLRKPFSHQDIIQCAQVLGQQHRQNLELKKYRACVKTVRDVLALYDAKEVTASATIESITLQCRVESPALY